MQRNDKQLVHRAHKVHDIVHESYDAYVFDMDGTVYLGAELLPGVKTLMTALTAAGKRRVFLTNNPTKTRERYASKLTALGLATDPNEIMTSATLTAAWLKTFCPDDVCFVLGEAPLVSALRDAGIRLSRDPRVTTLVLSSYDRTFDYLKLRIAFEALWRRPEVKFIATHPDAYCPFPGGRGDPDAAAITAAVQACTGRTCEKVIGKPSPEALLTALRLVDVAPGRAIMIGDRLATDIAMGIAAGAATALVLTGDSTLQDVEAAPDDKRPTYVLSRIDALAAPLLMNAQPALETSTMTHAIQLNPKNLKGFYDDVSRASETDRTLTLSSIRVGETVLDEVADFVIAGSNIKRVLLVQDETPITRNGVEVKPLVAEKLRAAGLEVEVFVLHDPVELHTTNVHIAEVGKRLQAGIAVLALGSGTVTDISKHAVFEFETAHPDAHLPLAVIQTANSVCAFTSGFAVVTTDGVKRTIPSRLPNRLMLDTTLLAQAPRKYTLGGVGDAAVSASSIADYRLTNMLGLSRFEPVSWRVLESDRDKFLRQDPIFADAGEAGAANLSLDLVLCGFSMTFAGESAPLSGLEHVTSHMLDMCANFYGRSVGNHGCQCGLATALSLIAFERLLNKVDLLAVDLDSVFPNRDAEREAVRKAFGHLDSTGAIWQECWADYSKKLDAWAANRTAITTFVAKWNEYREELRSYLTTPKTYLSALAATGHPLYFEDVPPGIAEAQARWAFSYARMMRKRLSVADVLYFFGFWNDEFVDSVFTQFHDLRGTITNQTTQGSTR
jgi:phosphoglycolate/pyridoxal phosphate phosphatase family enzyme